MNAADRKYFVDVFGDVVTNVQTAYDQIGKPYYMYGHPLEIANVLTDKGKSPTYQYKRYPVICLLQDFEERINYRDEYYELPEVTVLIITETKPEFLASERYIKTFKSILYPLYELLIEEMEYNENFSEANEPLNYRKIDRLFWGKTGIQGNDGLVFNDYLDCIELKFSNLRIKKYC